MHELTFPDADAPPSIIAAHDEPVFARLRARDLIAFVLLLGLAMILVLAIVTRTLHTKLTPQLIGAILTATIGLPLPILARRAGLDWRRLFGPAPTRAELPLATIVLPVALATIGAALLVYVPLSYVAPRFVERTLLDNEMFTVRTLGQWAMLMLAASVLAPLLEETFFRGFLMQRWGHRWGTRTGVVLSSALFGVLHGEWLGHFVFGVAMSALYLRTRKLWLPIIAHALNNFVLTVSSLHEVLTHAPPSHETLAEFRASFWLFVPVLAASLATLWAYRRYVWGEMSLASVLARPIPYEQPAGTSGHPAHAADSISTS